MTDEPFDRWFVATDHQNIPCVWLATRDEDPYPFEFAALLPSGRIVIAGSWPLASDELGQAMRDLHAIHQERHPRITAAIREVKP